MLISIVTPTYNSEEYLEECILSIKNQKLYNFEHIIVDGGSNDKTLDVIKKYENTYPMHWISEKDNGMYDAIQKGFKLAKGDILCWLNSDDRYMPWSTIVMEKICINKTVNWCSGFPSYITCDGIGYQKIKFRTAFSKKCIKKGYMRAGMMGCIQQESCFWTRELWEKSGGIDTQYKSAGDFHLWKNFAKYEQLYVVNSVIAGFRIHSGQKSSDRKQYDNECGKIKRLESILLKLKIFKLYNKIIQIWKRKTIIDINTIINEKYEVNCCENQNK